MNYEQEKYTIIQKEINRNKQTRINWREILGESVSKTTTRYYKQGLPVDIAYTKMVTKALNHGINDYESLHKLKIGVCSMYCKLETLKRVK